MGDIADAMLDGTMCECCGEYMGEGEGYPQYCSPECAGDRGVEFQDVKEVPKQRCPQCGKYLKNEQGVKDHIRDKH